MTDQPIDQSRHSPQDAESFAIDHVAEDAANSVAQRYQRYLPVVQTVAEQVVFDLDAIKQAVQPERPAFVTRVVKELLNQGWLLRGEGTDSRYRWNADRGPFCPRRWLDDKLLGSQVKISPQHDRPRERLLHVGVEQLHVAELLAILVRSGRPGESAVQAGQKLARHFQQRLDRLPLAGRMELKNISTAIDVTAYCQIMAGIELGRRVAAVAGLRSLLRINSTQDAINFCQQHFQRLAEDGKQEQFHVVTLDTKRQVIDSHQITVGTLDASLVHPREVFRPAIRDAASAVLLAHNHPSGDPTPSRADLTVTQRLVEVGKLIGIEVLDHIIIGNPTVLSMRANGDL
ncbi:MAG: DNA repair protein RadC [Planctomycetaceae bacterium]|nr:DNA repair protein RadC [Planctomycetaceae bacterium]